MGAAVDSAAIRETFYISHGSPTLSIDVSLPARKFLQEWKEKVFGARPRAILVISGHWETDVPAVNAVDGTLETIHDFYGFPEPMYKLKYPAPGSPQLANRVRELLMKSGFDHVNVDKNRGLDHGAWVPLMLMYPEADIPVCELSVQTNRDGTHHYNVGKALAPLMDEGVLVFGSGSATHNLRAERRDDGVVQPWAAGFDNWLEDSLLNARLDGDISHSWGDEEVVGLVVDETLGSRDADDEVKGMQCTNFTQLRHKYDEVNHWDEKAPYAKNAHPHPDHFYPLHVAIGAAGGDPKAELIHRSWTKGTLSYASYKFTPTSTEPLKNSMS